MKELITIKSNLTEKMKRLDTYSNDLPLKTSCIPEFFIDESNLYNQLSQSYFNRINCRTEVVESTKTKIPPKCSEFMPLGFSVGLFEHLEAMKNRDKLKMEPEDSFGSKELGTNNSSLKYYCPIIMKQLSFSSFHTCINSCIDLKLPLYPPHIPRNEPKIMEAVPIQLFLLAIQGQRQRSNW